MSKIPNGAVQVLDHGYVLLTRLSHDVHYSEEGQLSLSPSTELAVVADARVSTDRTATEFGKKEAGTLNFLLREEHTSPFRGTVLQFEVKAPLFICAQWKKYLVGHDHEDKPGQDPFFSWNERSFRYTEADNEFYRPKVWRLAPEKRAQGSGGAVPPSDARFYDLWMSEAIELAVDIYDAMIEGGVCAEQARLVLPAYALYTSWRWTCSLQGLCHFLSQRLAHDAQSEIREYAEAVKQIARPLFPATIDAMGRPKGGE